MGFFDSLVEVASDIGGFVADTVCDGVEYAVENPGKVLTVVACTVVTGGVAAASAPTIGAFVSGLGMGTAGGTLSGAAAQSAGLAAIGGGSVASGGGGMALGTAIVTGAGAGTGTAVGAGVVYAIDDEH